LEPRLPEGLGSWKKDQAEFLKGFFRRDLRFRILFQGNSEFLIAQVFNSAQAFGRSDCRSLATPFQEEIASRAEMPGIGAYAARVSYIPSQPPTQGLRRFENGYWSTIHFVVALPTEARELSAWIVLDGETPKVGKGYCVSTCQCVGDGFKDGIHRLTHLAPTQRCPSGRCGHELSLVHRVSSSIFDCWPTARPIPGPGRVNPTRSLAVAQAVAFLTGSVLAEGPSTVPWVAS
jgi:hypothetical protein